MIIFLIMFDKFSLYTYFILIFSLSFHEYFHAWAAYRCGDDTAKDMGRMTLNPLPHIDFIGTFLVPVFMMYSGSSMLFAWAKPVPVNPANFNNPKNDIVKVGISGPLSNIAIAVAAALAIGIIGVAKLQANSINWLLWKILHYTLYINLLLAVFNLLPIPPLDGSQVLSGFLTARGQAAFAKLEPYGFIIIIFLLYTGILGMVLTPVVRFLAGIFLWNTGGI